MTPETTGPALLDAIARTLCDELAPMLSGEARFKVLMAASAVRMAMREVEAGEELRDAAAALGGNDQSALVAAIRAGLHDEDAALHAVLEHDAKVRTSVSKPAAV